MWVTDQCRELSLVISRPHFGDGDLCCLWNPDRAWTSQRKAREILSISAGAVPRAHACARVKEPRTFPPSCYFILLPALRGAASRWGRPVQLPGDSWPPCRSERLGVVQGISSCPLLTSVCRKTCSSPGLNEISRVPKVVNNMFVGTALMLLHT